MWQRKGIPTKVKDLYDTCAKISRADHRYLYGGGHNMPLSKIRSSTGLDCSSSVSLALYRVGLFIPDHAWASGMFSQWGVEGKGEYFTVWENPNHVWIQFHRIGKYWRFDTSPWGYGGNGPRMRMTPRTTYPFKPRHMRRF